MNKDNIYGALDCLSHLVNNVLSIDDARECVKSYVENYNIKIEDLEVFKDEYCYDILIQFVDENGNWVFDND